MRALDLTENMILLCSRHGLLLTDRRPRRFGDSEPLGQLPEPDEWDGPHLPAVLTRFDATRTDADGKELEILGVDWEEPHEIYGGKVLEGVARIADGSQEYWRLRVEPLLMRFHWTRQPERVAGVPAFRIRTACRTDALQFWHTGAGQTLSNAAAPDAAEGRTDLLESAEECEILYYSTAARNCMRIELAASGAIRVRRDVATAAGMQWQCDWEAHPAAVIQLSVTCGLAHATRHFDGRQRMQPTNATLDFDQFYARAYLGTFPLNLERRPRGFLGARATALSAPGAPAAPAGLREIAWAGEFLYLIDPVVAAALARDTLQAHVEATGPVAGLWPEHRLSDEEAALLLLLAGRYHRVSGDTAFLAHHVEALRRCALHLLGLRRAGRAIPAVLPPWEPPGAPRTEEPAYAALAFAGLSRLAEIENALGYDEHAVWWLRAARAIQAAALLRHEDGGLWDAEHGVFIRGQELTDEGEGTPRANRDFLLYQNVLAFFLGLAEDPAVIRTAYDWIDDNYTYAAGRGERTMPPGDRRGFITLLDVYVRHRHDVPGAMPLLAFLLGRALDGGLPFPVAPFGAYARGGPLGEGLGFAHTATGSLLDGSPFFGIVLGQHYGLEYDHRGWTLGKPKPLQGYPVTRVTHLRHRHARYAVTWQRSGRPGRVLLDGKPYHSPVLSLGEGDHEVIVQYR